MKLENNKIPYEYICDLTVELDKLSGLQKSHSGICDRWFRHYLLLDEITRKDIKNRRGMIPIRVPDGTIGALYVDVNTKKIVKISIDTNYVIRTYPNDLMDQLEKFIGEDIEFEEMEVKLCHKYCKMEQVGQY